MNNMRRGFTMIELIFVIVIIGILAAVAIPKLAATRDDAKVSAEVASLRQVIDNLGAEYTASGDIPDTSYTAANLAINCFSVTKAGANTDGNFTVASIATNAKCSPAVLAAAEIEATNANLLEANAGDKVFSFGGSNIVR